MLFWFLLLCVIGWLLLPDRFFVRAIGWLVGLRVMSQRKIRDIKDGLKKDKEDS
ncbi:MAG: hypothetical protein ACXAEN_25460 [Candidatus Thorarchaeota archaeon]|jgi:hypothetical protein